jgi:hypothetical protein
MNKKHAIICGIFINVLFAIILVALSTKYYKQWDTFKKIYPDKWLATDEEFLHACYVSSVPNGVCSDDCFSDFILEAS